MDHSCCKIRQPWISFLSNWPLPAISLRLADMWQSSTGGKSQIGTNTTHAKHSFISNEGIRLPASSAPQRWVPYDCQIPLHAIYIIIQSAVYRTRMGSSLFVVWRLEFILGEKKSSCTHVKRRLLLYSMSQATAWGVLWEDLSLSRWVPLTKLKDVTQVSDPSRSMCWENNVGTRSS